ADSADCLRERRELDAGPRDKPRQGACGSRGAWRDEWPAGPATSDGIAPAVFLRRRGRRVLWLLGDALDRISDPGSHPWVSGELRTCGFGFHNAGLHLGNYVAVWPDLRPRAGAPEFEAQPEPHAQGSIRPSDGWQRQCAAAAHIRRCGDRAGRGGAHFSDPAGEELYPLCALQPWIQSREPDG